MSKFSRGQFLSLFALSFFASSLGWPQSRKQEACNYTHCVSNKHAPPFVNLRFFKGTQINDTVKLHWEAETERRNASFEVYHQPPKSNWREIGFVAGINISPTTKTYRLTLSDIIPLGFHQFQLSRAGRERTQSQYEPISVKTTIPDESEVEAPLELTPPVPNPASSTASLKIGVRGDSHVVVTLYNIIGQQIAILYKNDSPPEAKQSIQIDTQNLPSGSYFIQARTRKHTRIQRLVVIH